MSLIVKTVTKITLGFILLYGVYISVNGHSAPGGGFAGGVIVALAFILMMLAFGKEAALKRLKSNVLRVVVSISGLAFLVFTIFNNEIIIPLCEMAIVGFGLFAIFTALVLAGKSDKNAE